MRQAHLVIGRTIVTPEEWRPTGGRLYDPGLPIFAGGGMSDSVPGSGVVRDHFVSADVAEIEGFLRDRFFDGVALSPDDGVPVEWGYDTTATDVFAVGHSWTTMPIRWEIGPVQDMFVVEHMRDGGMVRTGSAYGECGVGRDCVVVVPPVGEFRATAGAIDVDLVALGSAEVACLAEYVHGPTGADLRIDALSPMSREHHDSWLATVRATRDEVLGNPLIAQSAIALDHVFRDLAALFLTTFPNSVLAFVEEAGTPRSYVSESTLCEVREYMRAHAGEPVGPQQIAAVAGAPAGPVIEALRRRDARHPAHLLWEARLQGVRRDLLDSDPSTTAVDVVAARWGFVRLPTFRIAYEKAFGEAPEDTLD